MISDIYIKVVHLKEYVSYSSAERTPVSKHISVKEVDMSARSSTACPTPEFQMSVLLVRDEHSGSQKELHNRSPAMRIKSIHSRDKSSLRARDTLRLVNEEKPASSYEVRLPSWKEIRAVFSTYVRSQLHGWFSIR